MLKATCCSLRVVEAPQGNTIQQASRTLLSWTLARNWVANSASWSPAPASRLSSKRGRRIQWKGKGIFYGEELPVCCVFQHTPHHPLERGLTFFPHLEKWEAWAMGASENPPKCLTMSQQLCTCQPSRSWYQTTTSDKIIAHLWPWPSSPAPPIPLVTAAKGRMRKSKK